jgi:rhamnosyltransferase subunit B
MSPRWLKSILYRIGDRFAIDRTVCPFLNEWRRELGLPPVKRITRSWHSPYGVLCMFPRWYAEPQPDWPANVIQTDFPLWNHRQDGELPEEVLAFLKAEKAPVVFMPGSANIHAHRFFAVAVEACRCLGRPGILLTEFPEQLPADRPEWVAHFPYVPLDLLLPHAAAFVHHGGIGSTSQGMLAGIPQVVTPLAHDQFDNAARVRRLGLGASIPLRHLYDPWLMQSLELLLESEAVAESCRMVAEQLAGRDGLRLSADAVENLVTGRDSPAKTPVAGARLGHRTT